MDDMLEVTGRCGERGQGPFMYVTLRCGEEMVVTATFDTYGCPTAYRCGTWITQWAVGRERSTLKVITPDDLRQVLGGLPMGKEHCADLAVDALCDAVTQWEESAAHPVSEPRNDYSTS